MSAVNNPLKKNFVCVCVCVCVNMPFQTTYTALLVHLHISDKQIWWYIDCNKFNKQHIFKEKKSKGKTSGREKQKGVGLILSYLR